MKQFKLRKMAMLTAIVLMCSTIADAQTVSLPYFCGFEDASENVQWTLNAGPQGNTSRNKWYVSTAEVYAGDSALDISADGGVTASYANSPITIVAYRTFTLPAGTYDLSFTYYAGGEGTLDCLKACWVPGSTTVQSAVMGTPAWLRTNAFTINGKTEMSLTGGWKVANTQITSTGAAMKLVFAWINNGNNNVPPGGCVDNVQIATRACGKPTNVNATANGSSIVVTWSGNATTYDLQYRAYGSSTVTTITGITGTSYTINNVGEGIYDFLVRSDCPTDTSLWVIAQNVIVYDPAAHCIDFRNLTDPGVTCTYGSYSNPKQTTGIIDNGPSQMSSRHTVHSTPGETDPRTGGGLPTIPKGEVVSVRLGNWNNGSEAETVTYTYTVPANSNVIMMLKYAVVFEEPGHSEPPEFNMKITNLAGASIGSCTEATFLCDGSNRDATWHECNAMEHVWWKEWTQVGFNLSGYAGQTLRICFTTKDCNASGHYGYAYYALSCSEAQITGLSCGDVAESKVEAPAGFNYQWYKKSDPNKTIVGTNQQFSVQGTDTATYVCKVVNKANPNCFFTLEASLLPRNPLAQFTPQWQPVNCENRVLLQNTSSVITQRGVTSEQPEYYRWNIVDSLNNDTIIKGDKTESPTITVPNEGGVYIIELIAAISGGMCLDTMRIAYNVPKIHEVTDTIRESICQGTVYIFNGQKLNTTGVYTASAKGLGGCDSTIVLDLEVVDKIDTTIYDTICDGKSYDFNGNKFTKTGEYKSKLKSAAGCDSVVTLNLFVYDPIVFTYTSQNEQGAPRTGWIKLDLPDSTWRYTVNGVDSGRLDSLTKGHYIIVVRNRFGCESAPVDIELTQTCVAAKFVSIPPMCADDVSQLYEFKITQGQSLSYNLRFSAEAVKEGFKNVDSVPINMDSPYVLINNVVDKEPYVNDYTVNVEFNDVICGPTVVPLKFKVIYANTVLEQKWNDVIAVLNEKYNDKYRNPGYKFSDFQWYKNGVKLDGEILPYIYIGNDSSTFDVTSDRYAVELTRVGETKSYMTCEIIPVLHTDVSPYMQLCVGCAVQHMPASMLELSNITESGVARWYSITGQMLGAFEIDNFNNVITTPDYSGIYLLEIIVGANRQVYKVMITEK
ncbi:MAG: hypothetical protein MJZ95_03210 [Paludibacteraceae bacterium]|nr:hypothetical protein [Paludibacteraceae bacterium]